MFKLSNLTQKLLLSTSTAVARLFSGSAKAGIYNWEDSQGIQRL